VNAVWFGARAICTYIIGSAFYARLIEMKSFARATTTPRRPKFSTTAPDFVPTDGACCSATISRIAGAGPLVGPVLAAQMGYLPCSIWIIFGAVFAGAVQDYWCCGSHAAARPFPGPDGRDEIGAVGGAAALIGAFVIMVIIIAVLALVVVRALSQSPGECSPSP